MTRLVLGSRNPGKIVELRRLGKRICFGFEDDLWLVLHLMIAGRLHLYDDPAKAALEVDVVDRVEAHERREQAPVGLDGRIAEQESALPEPRVHVVERHEHRAHDPLVVRLVAGEARRVYGVVDLLVQPRVERVDRVAVPLGPEVDVAGREPVERGRVHPQDVGRLVVDDRAGCSCPTEPGR